MSFGLLSKMFPRQTFRKYGGKMSEWNRGKWNGRLGSPWYMDCAMLWKLNLLGICVLVWPQAVRHYCHWLVENSSCGQTKWTIKGVVLPSRRTCLTQPLSFLSIVHNHQPCTCTRVPEQCPQAGSQSLRGVEPCVYSAFLLYKVRMNAADIAPMKLSLQNPWTNSGWVESW